MHYFTSSSNFHILKLPLLLINFSRTHYFGWDPLYLTIETVGIIISGDDYYGY